MSDQLKDSIKDLKLVPMKPLNLGEVKTTAELLGQMAGTAFTGRALGEAVEVMEEMRRQDAFVVMTLSGAMTMAGMIGLMQEAIERGWVHCIVATGALVGHGLVEDLGMAHYKAKSTVSDEEYFERRLNRVYDVLEPEDNLDRLEERVRAAFVEMAQASDSPVGTIEMLRHLGEKLPGKGVLQSAAKADIPIIIPAFTDSELGLDFAVHMQRHQAQSKSHLQYDAFSDLTRYAQLCEKAAADRPLGIFTIGGGVPRNWAQQVGPYVDIRNKRLGTTSASVRFRYGVRICPDPVHYGHLSGCTYSEGVSWGKFVPIAEGGRYAEVLLDATVGWPLLTQALIEKGW